jgi:hypothetical protein
VTTLEGGGDIEIRLQVGSREIKKARVAAEDARLGRGFSYLRVMKSPGDCGRYLYIQRPLVRLLVKFLPKVGHWSQRPTPD